MGSMGPAFLVQSDSQVIRNKSSITWDSCTVEKS